MLEGPIIKFCGIRCQRDADKAASLGISLMGFIFHPESPRYISPQDAQKINAGVSKKVGVFVKERGNDLKEKMDISGVHLAQFHGDQDENDALLLGKERVIRVLWPERYENAADLLEDMDKWASLSKYILLDSGKSGGGHGRVMMLEGSNFYRLAKNPYILAGGLNKENISGLWPSQDQMLLGFDFNSGVE
ncbi:MAG: phosphoribosylanthranilate isomerase, partial [Deltaproteobacteria bacterium]|nr:phosphoribosylanthranilate isomerase [Deltaproteobacteria bacterium]